MDASGTAPTRCCLSRVEHTCTSFSHRNEQTLPEITFVYYIACSYMYVKYMYMYFYFYTYTYLT